MIGFEVAEGRDRGLGVGYLLVVLEGGLGWGGGLVMGFWG